MFTSAKEWFYVGGIEGAARLNFRNIASHRGLGAKRARFGLATVTDCNVGVATYSVTPIGGELVLGTSVDAE